MNRDDLRTNGSRLWDSIMEMAKIGATAKGGSCRLALTDEDKAGRDLFVRWCEEAGCKILVDRMGNIFAQRPGLNNDLPPIAMGSHLDTQPHGGKFDGIYGVLSGLEVIRSLNEHQVETKAPVEVIVWTNEEGARFAPAMISSGVYAGLLDLDYALSRQDENGVTLGEELQRIGYEGTLPCGEHQMGALFEAHIEQGPILEQNHHTIGIVQGAQGQSWFDVTVVGKDCHAGTTPMSFRQDALVAAAKVIGLVEEIALDYAPHAVGTVGALSVSPNSRNTIPGQVNFSVDIRHPEEKIVQAMGEKLQAHAKNVAKARNVTIEIEEIWHKPPISFDKNCVSAVAGATQKLGYSSQEIVSGAGHDACQVCEIVPTAMIFVPCAEGVSHNEAESAEPEDLEAGCNVLLHTVLEVAGSPLN